MAEEKILTMQGKKELEAQLEALKREMVDIIDKIKEAREFGDLSENAEYDAAKTDQAQTDAKIQEIEYTLRTAKIIDDTKLSRDAVSLGCTVKFLDIEENEELTVKIVGTAEADPSKGKLSNASPVGAAILGKKKGEIVSVNAPGGEVKIKIIKIS